jgi:hypothetical protein
LSSANGKTVFGADGDRRKLNEIVAQVVGELGVRVHAYCWLNNEIEVVAETGAVAPERFIRKIANAYTAAVGDRLGRNGTLFSDAHICYEPQTPAELADIVRSMHVRPVVLDLTEESTTYPWSSARAYAGLEDIAWLSKGTLAPLLERAGGEAAIGDESRAQSAPRMIAAAVEAKLSREMPDRSRIWMARALIAWIVTRDGVGNMAGAATRLGVDTSALEHSMHKYRDLAPDLFETPLAQVMSWRGFEVASPKVRKDIADILSTISQWSHPQ